MGQLTLPPDYFRTAAELYQQNPSDRKAWLQDQIAKANSSLLQYQAELNEITAALVKLGAMPGSGGIITTAGGVLAALPTGYTKIIGGILIVAGAFFSKVENKQKAKQIEQLKQVGLARYNEAVQVGEYKTRYEKELAGLRMIPVALTAVILWLIIK
ncbi:hypothetical protein [Dyadobacter sediminis]|uniref:Uncharacterized protein n=1 Tax=Dyadobacter sediminis TaxID=1493691 RepID=A0A5R9KBA3_9BACT|nr:hypothetical protein [Dyadobacter sediminis]TLU91997.1 hypothetical protein FEM55_14650 [Dyadobacter sediminis]GGB98369.1 hypothetical protein GCM10011325_27070 [Dyadobacter sediminis]